MQVLKVLPSGERFTSRAHHTTELVKSLFISNHCKLQSELVRKYTGINTTFSFSGCFSPAAIIKYRKDFNSKTKRKHKCTKDQKIIEDKAFSEIIVLKKNKEHCYLLHA